MPKSFKIINLSNTMGECGYEVNDAHYTGQELETDNDLPTLQEAIDGLKERGMLKQSTTVNDVMIDEDDPFNSITLRDKNTGHWLYELRYEPVR